LGSEEQPEIQLRGHIPALDGIRGFAAATVFLYHYGGGAQSTFIPLRLLGQAFHFGWAGVSLFFVLSGFLISGILWDGFQKPNWWKRFYARRSLRIFPLYYLAILITFIGLLVLGSPLRNLSSLWIYLLYLGNIPSLAPFLIPLPQEIPLNHFWSLAVEEQFYLFWPFLLLLCAGKRSNAKRLILGMWVVSFAYRVAMLALHFQTPWQWEFILGRVGELGAGAYLAMAIRGDAQEKRQLFRWLPWILGISFCLLLPTIVATNGGQFDIPLMSTVGLGICSIFFASLVGLALKPGWVQSIFSNRVLRWLGKISYGIYVYHLLLHYGFIWIANRIAPNASHNAQAGVLFLVALVGTLTAASLSFYTFESAFLRWKERVAH
jgi:peptidoglycan/LPS O-acetylase OafA/YrhL